MLRKFFAWLLYRCMGWQKDITIEQPKKCILCVAPHTSNWDFIIGQLFVRAEGMHANFLMKREWFFWPLGPIFKRWGGIPVYRDKNLSLTEILSAEAKKADKFCLCITPEGTRQRNPQWKRGFYYIALNAQIPILLYAIDFERKLISCTAQVQPTGQVEEEIKQIKQHYKDIKGRYPEQFAIE